MHLHRWSLWELYDQKLMNRYTGRTWTDQWERRRCERCGATRERPVRQ